MKWLTQESKKLDAVSLGSELSPGKPDVLGTCPYSTEQAQSQTLTLNTLRLRKDWAQTGYISCASEGYTFLLTPFK